MPPGFYKWSVQNNSYIKTHLLYLHALSMLRYTLIQFILNETALSRINNRVIYTFNCRKTIYRKLYDNFIVQCSKG